VRIKIQKVMPWPCYGGTNVVNLICCFRYLWCIICQSVFLLTQFLEFGLPCNFPHTPVEFLQIQYYWTLYSCQYSHICNKKCAVWCNKAVLFRTMKGLAL
jgi:hypothetical protein